MSNNLFTCACCKEEFNKTRNEEEAIQERDVLFGNLPEEDQVIVCEPCFIKIMDFNETNLKRYAPFIDVENMDT